ncbi:hypothetical protein DBV05_g9314 [Lasiodiplodia theobromae]|uniref:Uncharacterized protein n=1 Tax=Lasiodiplodia theobromae TaxID=45133 RepID=A0A5N5D3W8_9PEZI|nr:hypothetical protein DBV05_g9314 [Lasiodiplodia theobromae]
MTTPPDLSLPPTAPVERYRDEPMSLLPTALYTLVELSDAELDELQRECESEIPDATPGDNVRRPADTQARFVGSPLRAVYDYHLELGPLHTFDPIYFIVATNKEWKTRGVLLVTLDDGNVDEPGCKTDSFFIKAGDAGLTVSNLQIGNSDWFEEKESYEIAPGGDDGDDDDDDNNNGSKDKDTAGDDSECNSDDSDDSGPDPPPAHIKHIDTFAPLYVVSGIDAEKLMYKLEPGSSRKKNFETDYIIRWQATLTPQNLSLAHSSNPMTPPDPAVTADLVAQACARHPARCRKNPRLNRTRLLVADTPHYDEHGLVLVQLSWDDGITKPAHYQRIPAEEYAGFQQRYLDATGSHRPKHPLVLIVEPGVGTEGHAMAGRQALDPSWRTRGEHDKRVVYAPPRRVVPGRVNERIQWEKLHEAARWFPWVCRTRRFEAAPLVQRFFVWVDHADLAEKGIVVVVRVDWDGDVHRSDEELLALDLDGKVATLQVPAGEALDLIEAATVGRNMEGRSNDVVEFFR